MGQIICAHNTCKKPITNKQSAEYSQEYGDFYCCLDCAIEVFVDRARCAPIDFEDVETLESMEVILKRGKLFESE